MREPQADGQFAANWGSAADAATMAVQRDTLTTEEPARRPRVFSAHDDVTPPRRAPLLRRPRNSLQSRPRSGFLAQDARAYRDAFFHIAKEKSAHFHLRGMRGFAGVLKDLSKNCHCHFHACDMRVPRTSPQVTRYPCFINVINPRKIPAAGLFPAA